MVTAQLDHLVVSAGTLADGVAHLETALGVAMAGGGEHRKMGTHNRLLSLGPDVYLEVIAVNPAADTPPHPRLFDLDNFQGEPRLTNWVMRVNSLSEALALAPPGTGENRPLERGDYRWRMAVPADGCFPFGGASPGMIEWLGAHPAPLLPDTGCRLRALEISHPQAGALGGALAPFLNDDRVSLTTGPGPAFRAEIATPHGLRMLA